MGEKGGTLNCWQPAPGRCRTVCISIDRASDEKLKARVAAANAAGRQSSFSEEIRRSIESVDGNHRQARHGVRNRVYAIRLALKLLKRNPVRVPEDVAALRMIADAAEGIGEALGKSAASPSSALTAARAPRLHGR